MPSTTNTERARAVAEKISNAAIELAFIRHELTTTDYEETEYADVEEGVEAFKELVESVKADVLAVLTGDETGCLDPEDVDTDNELEFVHRALTAREQEVQGEMWQRKQRELFDECVTAQWDAEHKNSFAEEIAHLHEELSEAFRAWRRFKDFEVRVVDGKPEGIPIEFADVLIGLFYNAELHGFDLMAAVERKHQFNLQRNYTAEGRQLHEAAARQGGE